MARLRHTLGLLLLLAASPPAVVAQSPSRATEYEALGHPSLTGERAALTALVTRARSAGLPAELLVEKVREGTAKRVPAARITQAVTVLHQRMEAADRLLVRLPIGAATERREAIHALIDAMNAGLSEADLADVIAKLGDAGRQPRVVAEVAVTMAELSERGFARESVVRAIALAWERGGVRAMPSVIVAAAAIGSQVAARDVALEQSVSQIHVPPGLGHASGPQGNSAAREPGPPHDDGFDQGQNRGRGKGKGPRP